MPSVLPAVRAELAERFIFNFRVPPASLRSFLPVSWLVPQEINGWAVASYCLLDLRNITIAPLPPKAGLHSLSCAPRFAVLDHSVEPPRPAVFLTERYTNSSFAAWFTSLGFSAPHPYLKAIIKAEDNLWRIEAAQPQSKPVFEATVHRTQQCDSQLWNTTGEFADFIAQGVSSYGLSIRGSRLTMLDLHKQDGVYEPLEIETIGGSAIDEWQKAGAVFDSAFRTSGGRYEWTYRGLTDENSED